MLLNGTIVAPRTKGPCGTSTRSLGGFLPCQKLLQIYPFSLRFGQEGGAGLRAEVANDDTSREKSSQYDS